MKSVILGTAGHVDHGKTALVEALTGVNTDRWAEERERGITIDLGFAPFPSGSDELEISVVDVPGHEDFVKNMLAGATGVDLLLLVVAADEGPMPQTREHLWIARLLGVERGVVAVTKSDLAEPDWCDLVSESVREELEKVFGPNDWPFVTVSAVTGQGLAELRARLLQAAGDVRARSDDDLFRLPVDRSFSVRGVGTVVTGTVWSGRVQAATEVRILPEDRSARVRAVQVHGRETGVAHAGQRAAVALVGVERSQVGRGDVLASDPVWRSTRQIDARLDLVPDSPWPLKHWQRVRFHLGTAETLARVVLFERDQVRPGEDALIQLRLEEPVVARAGDRFVLRFYSPVTTIGGGIVLDPWAERRGRRAAAVNAGLQTMAAAESVERLGLVLEARRAGASVEELSLLSGLSPAAILVELGSLTDRGAIREVGSRWFGEAALRAARESVLDALSRAHAREPGARGLSLESLRSGIDALPDVVNAALSDLQGTGEIRVEGSTAALPDHVPRLSPEQRAVAEAALSRIRAGQATPPTVKELAASLGVRGDELLPLLKFLVDQSQLVAVTADLYLDSGAISDVKQRVKAALGKGGAATPSELREVLGVSRKYLIPLLEYLDGIGFTQRSGEGRVLRDLSPEGH
jgi:selenocysteine-specific elongation factor